MFTVRNTASAYLIGMLTILTVVGCGKQSDISKVIVKGSVTYDGQPISNGEIRFHPTGDTRGPLSGGTIQEGTYIAEGRGGVPIGSHRVEILAYRPLKTSRSGAEGGPVEQYLPRQYNSNTTLVVTIDKESFEQDFNLTSR